MSEKLEVRYLYTGIQDANHKKMYHKYIIYTDSSGVEYFARGGTTLKDGSWPTVSAPLGIINTSYGLYQPGTVDYQVTAPHYEVLLTGTSLSAQWGQIKAALDSINGAHINYFPNQNSNSVVDTALTWAGVPLPSDDLKSGDYWAPGSGVILDLQGNSQQGQEGVPIEKGIIEEIISIELKYNAGLVAVCPLVLDLDNDGIELSEVNKFGSVYWDGDVDGFKEASGWVKPDDGLLVRDTNLNGIIDDNSELFGNNVTYANGFLNLAALDSNGSNTITSADAQWGTLKVWKDANQDGISQSSELFSLSSLGITQINLAYSSSTSQIAGNDIKQISTFIQNGITKTIVDAWFATDQVNSVYGASTTLNDDVLYLPTLRGYGTLADLHVAMSQNSSLLSAVKELALIDLKNLILPTTLENSFKSVLYKWAGVDAVIDGSRGFYVNAKDLAFYEKFMGQNYYQTFNATANPLEIAADPLNQGLKLLFDHLYTRFMFQAGGDALFSTKPVYNPVTDSFEGNATLNPAAIQTLFSGNTLPTHQLAQEWLTVFSMLDKAFNISNLSEIDQFALKNIVASTDPTGSITFEALLAQTHLSAVGTAGSDIIAVSAPSIVVSGGNGNDILLTARNGEVRGDAGDDIYILNPAHGSVVTLDESASGVGNGIDTIVVQGYTGAQVTIARSGFNSGAANNLDIFASGVKVATIVDQFANSNDAIEFIKLNDGSVINLLTQQYTTTGSASGEIIYGINAGANPDDIAYGLGGDDSIYGYAGNDRINGGSGVDNLYGGTGNDTYVIAAGEGGDVINEQYLGGNDTIEFTGTGLTNLNLAMARSGDDLQIGFSGTLYATIKNYFSAGSEIETIKFSDGTTKDLTSEVWTWMGATYSENLFVPGGSSNGGGNHKDIVYGYAGSDTLKSYAGNDKLYGGDGNDDLWGGNGNDELYGENDTDYLYGEDGNDRIDGGFGNDSLYGGAGNDTYVIVSGQGADTIDEGAYGGTDTIEFTGNTAWISSNFSAVQSGSYLSLRFSGVEAVSIYRGFEPGFEIEKVKFNDGTIFNLSEYEFVYTGNSNGNSVTAYPGNISNTFYGLGGSDTLYTYAGNDKLYGGDDDDSLYGGDGNDLLNGGSGNDIINGEAGIDTLTYSDATAGVTVSLAITTSQATGGSGSDTINTVENLIGSGFADNLTGDGGDNIIEGGLGDDILNGGLGIDTLSFASATGGITVNLGTTTSQNTVNAGLDTINGFENVNGTAFNDTITGDANANVISGGLGDDVLDGAGGVDTITFTNAVSAVTLNLTTTTSQNTGSGSDTITNFENVVGSDFNDVITGNTGNNTIEGGLGNDTLNGSSGTDTLSYVSAASGITVSLALTTAQNTGGAGTDTVSSFENLTGSGFNDVLTGTTGNNVIEGGAGDDLIDGGSGTDTLSYAGALAGVAVSLSVATAQATGGAGVDTIIGFENLTGSAFDDVLSGTSGVNTIDAGLGNDLVYADAGDDVLKGNTGTDTLSFANVASGITFNLTTTSAQNTGGAGTDTITGFENAIGSAFNDTITGTTIANTIEGGLGDDVLDGGSGTDTLSYFNSIAGVRVDLSVTSAQNTFGAGIDTITSFENIIGSAYGDRLSGTTGVNNIDAGLGNDIVYADLGSDVLNGGGGNDTLSFELGAAAATVNLATLTGQTTGYGTDTITNFENVIGSSLNDNLTGDGNANIIEGGLGNDTLNGAGGIDTISYAHAASRVVVNLSLTTAQNTLGAGTDTVSSFENLTGSAYNDDLTGTSGDNTIDGGAGDDVIHGGDGTDILIGGLGIDTVSYSEVTSAVSVNLASTSSQYTGSASGYDTLSGFENLIGGSGADTLTGNASANMIEGGLGNDTLNGGDGIDTVSYAGSTAGVTVNLSLTSAQNTGTGSGTDTITNFENIFASAFADTLTGNSGDNVINGRAGVDTLTGGLGADTFVFDIAGLGTSDTITDFSEIAGDKLNISELLVGYSSLQSSIDDFLTLTTSGGNTVVSVDRDGAGTTYSSQSIASLTGVTGLDADHLLQSGSLIAA